MDIGVFKNRTYVAVAIGIGLLVVLWLVFRPAAIVVETAEVKRMPLSVTIDAEGRTRVKNKYTVTAPVSGKMSRITLNEGDRVPLDYPLTQIDPNPPRPRPPSELDDRFNVSAVKIYSPAAGKILRIFDPSERYLEAGTPILEIGDPASIEIAVDVLSSDAIQVRPGQTVLIDAGEEGNQIKARVRTIEPQASTKVSALGVEEKRVDIIADFVGEKPPFGDNFRVDCSIITWQSDEVVSIPKSSLFRVGEQWNVFVVEGGRAYQRPVQAGHQSRTYAEIVSGLNEADSVVVHPPTSLADGLRVTSE